MIIINLIAHLYSSKRERKGVDLGDRRSREDLGGAWGGKIIIRMYYMKNLFSLSKKKQLVYENVYLLYVMFFMLWNMFNPMIPKGREKSSVKMYPQYTSFHVIWVIIMASDSDENIDCIKTQLNLLFRYAQQAHCILTLF